MWWLVTRGREPAMVLACTTLARARYLGGPGDHIHRGEPKGAPDYVIDDKGRAVRAPKEVGDG